MPPPPEPATVRAAPPALPRLDAALTRLGIRGPLARDALLAVGVALCSVGVLVPLLGPLAPALGVVFRPAEQMVIVLLVAMQALLLVLRRLRPATGLLAVIGLQVGLAVVLPLDTEVRLAAPVIAAYSVGAYLATRRAVQALAGALVLELVGGAVAVAAIRPAVRDLLIHPAGTGGEPRWSTGVLGWVIADLLVVLIYGGAALTGMVVASRRRYTALVEEQVAAAAAQERERIQAAVVAERSGMARELHDIAAHHLSGLIIQAAAAERLIDRDPEGAKRATRAVRAQGKETMANLRAVVGILRDGDGDLRDHGAGGHGLDGETGAPVPGAAVLDRLFDAARANGDDLQVTVRGEPRPLPPLADITVYRVLQEALANARQHAPGQPVRVVLDQDPAQVRLEVVNALPDRRPAGDARPGYGLVGMRERAQLSGAVLDAGPVDRTWRVRLHVPRAGQIPTPGPGEDGP